MLKINLNPKRKLKLKQSLNRWFALLLGILAGTAFGAVSYAQSVSEISRIPQVSEAEIQAELERWEKLANEAPETEDELTPQQILKEMRRDKTHLDKSAKSNRPGENRLQIDVFMRPVGLGITKEFMVLKKDGVVTEAYVVSTGKNGHRTIVGDFPLTTELRRGKVVPRPSGAPDLYKALKPYAFRVSARYHNSTMYWPQNIRGGFFMHSTPHYGPLGTPASMGCVRTTYPAAMEIWDLIVNQFEGSARMTIYGSDTPARRAAQKAAFEKVLTQVSLDWVKERVTRDLSDAHAISRGDYKGYGHARQGVTQLTFPKCADKDCFEYFGRKKPDGAL